MDSFILSVERVWLRTGVDLDEHREKSTKGMRELICRPGSQGDLGEFAASAHGPIRNRTLQAVRQRQGRASPAQGYLSRCTTCGHSCRATMPRLTAPGVRLLLGYILLPREIEAIEPCLLALTSRLPHRFAGERPLFRKRESARSTSCRAWSRRTDRGGDALPLVTLFV